MVLIELNHKKTTHCCRCRFAEHNARFVKFEVADEILFEIFVRFSKPVCVIKYGSKYLRPAWLLLALVIVSLTYLPAPVI